MPNKRYVMPERKPSDGPVGVGAPDEETISITITKGVQIETLVMSRYNAWRVFGMLSLMLKLPVTRAVGKAIQFDDGMNVTLVPETPLKTLGEKVAWHLQMQALKTRTGAE